MYRAVTIADYVVNRSSSQGNPVTALKLQNILYCIQKQFLLEGRRAFSDEIYAFPSGPAVPQVMQNYKCDACSPIEPGPSSAAEPVAPGDRAIIDRVVDSGTVPEFIPSSRKVGQAWRTVWHKSHGRGRIPCSMILRLG